MKLLLDTHVFLWWLADASMITEPARLEIASGRNPVYVSAVSLFEAAVKRQAGRLECPLRLYPHVQACRFHDLPLTLQHAEKAAELPPIHKDPFDRMLVAQAQSEGLTLVTRDATLARYDADLLPA